MRTVTEDFLATQRVASNQGIRRVQYKRRKWNQTTLAYEWESSWSTFGVDRFISVSSISHELDTDLLNEFKVANVTLNLQNADNFFRFDNPNGFFGQDSASPDYVYEPYWTKFKVDAGFVLLDGTEEFVTLFTGVATEFTINSDEKTVQIQIQGIESQLVNTKAEEIATDVVAENAGTGDSSETEFVTLNPGVGGITSVSIDGIAQIEGEDYTISDLDDPTIPGKVTFTIAPDTGEIIRIDYFYWPQNVEFHELVILLLEAAGITDYDVSSVVFGNSVIITTPYTTQEDWDTGTKNDVLSDVYSGSINIDFDGAGNKEATTWTQSLTGWTTSILPNATLSSDGTYINYNGGSNGASASAYHSQDRQFGSFEVKYQFQGSPVGVTIIIQPFATEGVFQSTGVAKASGPRFEIQEAAVAWRTDPSGTNGGNFSFSSGTTEHTFAMVRNGAFVFIYIDGVLMASDSSVGWPSSGVGFVTIRGAGQVNGQWRIREISIPAETVTGNWVGPGIDLGAPATGWGEFTHNEDTEVGEVTYFTRSGSNGIAWDAYVEVDGSVVGSELDQWIQVKVEFSISTLTGVSTSLLYQEPIVFELAVRATNTSAGITMPALTGMSCHEAIQAVAEFTNYEIGFDGAETFFFRSKTASSSILDADQSNFISKVSGLTSGYEKMYGVVRVTYGDHTREFTADADTSNSPYHRVGQRRFELNTNDALQIPTSVDIATGVAQGLLRYFSKRRTRMKLETKFLPQLELSDVITVSFTHNTPGTLWYLGDPQVNLSLSENHLWGDSDQLLDEMDVKIIGARYDVSGFKCEFDCEEVVT